MSATPPLWEANEERLVRYLLGDVPPEEQERIEARLFEEADFHEELRATGDDLIRAYLVGRLPADDRTRFETHFLASPRRRERLAFMRALLDGVEKTSGRARPAGRRATAGMWPVWLAVAAVLLVAAGLYFNRGRRDSEQRADRPSVRPTPAPRPVESAAPPPVQQAHNEPTPVPRTAPRVEIQRVRLPPEPAGALEISLAGETRLVRLEVPLEGPRLPTYDAEIRSGDDEPVWQARALVPNAPGEPLVLEVPARVLVAANYELHVSGERLRDTPPGAVTTRTFALHITRPPAR